ncbi:MAG TPA: HD domain-containing protein [Nitrolancea sp.]|nr:HD domain-containing protein [Nitrolancea sp.]
MTDLRATTIRDSLYDLIPLESADVALIETAEFLRLDRIQQLGFVSKVWPGAKHSRFEHSIGVYHLMRQALTALERVHGTGWVSADARRTAGAAALLHDVGHYPFSHAIEELGPPVRSHEEVGRSIIEHGEIARVLESHWHVNPERVANFINPRGTLMEEDRLLRGLLSGALDVDKLDYLPRDARNCNVPYGGVDTPRLLDSLRVAEVDGQPRIVVNDKGISPLYSLINARQEMFDNVYWHHTNRACMVMLLRAVQDALIDERISPTELTQHDDNSLLQALSRDSMPESTRDLVDALQRRRLHKRAIEINARAGELFVHLNALYGDPRQRREVERSIARQLGDRLDFDVASHEVLIDVPKPERWRTDVWVAFNRPPIGFRALMPWVEVVGLGDEDLKRYEEHRRVIRIVTTARVREIVRRDWERLLFPLLGGAS